MKTRFSGWFAERKAGRGGPAEPTIGRSIRRVTLLVLGLAVPLFTPVRAQEVEQPPSVPANFSATTRQPLVAQYAKLASWASDLQEKIAKFRTECSGLKKSETKRIAECQERKAVIDAEWQRYEDELSAYEQALASAAAAQSAFEVAVAKMTATAQESYAGEVNRLMTEIDQLKPEEPPNPPLTLHEAFILGLFDPQGDAEKSLVGLKSPFSGQAYGADQIFATAAAKTGAEAIRGVLDHRSIGSFTLNTEQGRALVGKLNGAQIDRLTAHSNGAMVAEALIRRGVITVKEFNIMGGDRALLNQQGLQLLINSGRVQRIVVWTNPGDVIPLWSSNVMANLAPFGNARAELASAAENLARTLTGGKAGGDTVVEYRTLSGPKYDGQTLSLDENFFHAHALTTYLGNVGKYFER